MDGNGKKILFQDGDIVPFKIKDPFIEFAFDKDEVIGVRLGFGEAQGMMLGDLESLTGNIDLSIQGEAHNLANALRNLPSEDCNVSCGLLKSADAIAPWIFKNVYLDTKAQLVYGPDAPSNLVGELDPVRGHYFGVENGKDFSIDLPWWLLFGATIDMKSKDCALLGLSTCYKTTDFQSFQIGTKDESGNLTGPASGFFMSAQAKDIAWMNNVKGENSVENYVKTIQGSFINIPTGNVQVNFVNSLNGINRARTEFIDRGRNLF